MPTIRYRTSVVAALLAGMALLSACGSSDTEEPTDSTSQEQPESTPTPTAKATPRAATKPKATTEPKSSPKPTSKPKTTPKPKPEPEPVSYANCTEVREAGAAPIREGEPGYSTKLDRDRDGIACDT
jgi:outer membrane biosynthesis protein TonB